MARECRTDNVLPGGSPSTNRLFGTVLAIVCNRESTTRSFTSTRVNHGKSNQRSRDIQEPC